LAAAFAELPSRSIYILQFLASWRIGVSLFDFRLNPLPKSFDALRELSDEAREE
jgi:hypothetical protein